MVMLEAKKLIGHQRKGKNKAKTKLSKLEKEYKHFCKFIVACLVLCSMCSVEHKTFNSSIIFCKKSILISVSLRTNEKRKINKISC